MVKLAPSILSSRFCDIRKDFEAMNRGGVHAVHVDVMDGHYVPNLTFGPPLIKQFRTLTDLPFDVHLMIERPELSLQDYVDAGADWITFHPDATIHSHRLVTQIKDLGLKAGVAINPGQGLDTVEYLLPEVDLVLVMTVNPGFGGAKFIESGLKKISQLREMIERTGRDVLIEVDGGVKLENAERILDAGADILVAGSAVFGADDPVKAMKDFQGLQG